MSRFILVLPLQARRQEEDTPHLIHSAVSQFKCGTVSRLSEVLCFGMRLRHMVSIYLEIYVLRLTNRSPANGRYDQAIKNAMVAAGGTGFPFPACSAPAWVSGTAYTANQKASFGG
jgi:hypothetical protein